MTAPSEQSPFVALKVHLRKYRHDGGREYAVTREIRERGLPNGNVALPIDAFDFNDGIVCLAYPIYGRDLTWWLKEQNCPFSAAETREIARKTLEFFDAFHSIGAAHTDIKPENLLYDQKTGDIRIIDFGNSERRFKRGTPVATREYTPPEGIIGGALSPAVDIWSLGCTFFEMLTGEILFDPHKAAAEKYLEFAEDEDEEEDEEDTPEDDRDGEFGIGELIGGKYRLIGELGRGNFATVWRARVEDPSLELEPLKDDRQTVEFSGQKEETERGAPPSEPTRPAKAREVRRNHRKRFGVTDAFDLALNYEHLLLMQRLMGPYPRGVAKDGIFNRVYFNKEGSLKFDPEVEELPPVPSIAERLANSGVTAKEAETIESFILPMLHYDISERATASECLSHHWLGL